MAITAATITKDRVKYDGSQLKSFFEYALPFITSSSNFNQGDLVCLDSSGHYLRRISADTDGATICGVAPCSVSSGVLVGPYPTGMGTIASQAIQAVKGPIYGCVFNMQVVASDSLTPGCKVFLAATSDSQTVTITDAADAGDNVGVYMGPTATAVAGTDYPVMIGFRKATGDTLQF